MLKYIVTSNWLEKLGWVVKKNGYENDMDGLETILTKNNLVMKVRWNDFPYLITVTCSVTGEMLSKQHVWEQSAFIKLAKKTYSKCPINTGTTPGTVTPTTEDALLYSSTEYILGDDFVILL